MDNKKKKRLKRQICKAHIGLLEAKQNDDNGNIVEKKVWFNIYRSS